MATPKRVFSDSLTLEGWFGAAPAEDWFDEWLVQDQYPTSASDGTLNGISTASHVAISEVLNVSTGSGGELHFTRSGIFQPTSLTDGDYDVALIWRYRTPGGSWTDVGTEVLSSVSGNTALVIGGVLDTLGTLVCSPTLTGLGAYTNYQVQLYARRESASPANSISFTGSASVTSLGGDVSVALTGQTAAISLGSVNKTSSKGLSGLTAALATGLVAPVKAIALGGQVASASLGTLTTSKSASLLGNTVSLSTGSVAQQNTLTLALTGLGLVAATGTVEVVAGVVTSITGQGITAATGTTVSSAARPITGLGQTVTLGTVVAVGTTAVALTGQSTSLSLGAVITSRTTLLSGTATALSAGLVVPSNSAAVSGLPAYADVGSLGSSRAITATGSGAALSLGSVSTVEEFFVALSGVESTTLLGSLVPYRELQLTGVTLSAHKGYFYVGTPSVVQEYGVRFFDGLRTHGNQRNPYKSLRGLEYAMWGRVLAACEYVPYVYTTFESPGILRIGYGRPIVDTEEAEEANLSKNREAVWLNTKLTELYQRVLTANPTAELHEVLTSTLYYYQSECQK